MKFVQFRVKSVPTDVAQQMSKGDKVFAWGVHGGGHIAATRRGIISTDTHQPLFLPWEHLLSATWSDPLLTVTAHTDSAVDTYSWLMSDAQSVPHVVRDRVSSIVVVDRIHTFSPGGQVRFIGRRSKDVIEWLSLPDDVEWAATSAGSRAIQAELEQLRQALGV